MTGKTTRIWVELTDEQMDNIETWEYSETGRVVRDAVIAQRPCPIAVGDRVQLRDSTHSTVYTVACIIDDRAWLWNNGKPWCDASITTLTRVDDETQP